MKFQLSRCHFYFGIYPHSMVHYVAYITVYYMPIYVLVSVSSIILGELRYHSKCANNNYVSYGSFYCPLRQIIIIGNSTMGCLTF